MNTAEGPGMAPFGVDGRGPPKHLVLVVGREPNRVLRRRQDTTAVSSTRSDRLQTVLQRACLYGRGACADCTLKSAALIKTEPTEWVKR